MKQWPLVCIAYVILCSFSCEPDYVTNPAAGLEVNGMRPFYTEISNEIIYSTEPQEVKSLENVILFGTYILVVEQLEGIHVINNEDPSNPVSVAFWNIPGITNFTISNSTLFVPIADKLVSIAVSDIHNIAVLGIQEGVFPSFTGHMFPEGFHGSFECVDPEKGVVIFWVSDILFDPQCWR